MKPFSAALASGALPALQTVVVDKMSNTQLPTACGRLQAT